MITKKTITRPANTTAYSTGDVINQDGATTPIELELAYATLNPYVINSHLVSSYETGTPTIRVLFYSESFTIAADNAAFAPTDAQEKNFLGEISHSTWTATAANKKSSAKPDAPISLPPVSITSSGISKVYVVLVAGSAYTPASGEEITIIEDVDA